MGVAMLPLLYAADVNGGLSKLGFSTGTTMESDYKIRPDYATGTVFAAERKDVPTYKQLWEWMGNDAGSGQIQPRPSFNKKFFVFKTKEINLLEIYHLTTFFFLGVGNISSLFINHHLIIHYFFILA